MTGIALALVQADFQDFVLGANKENSAFAEAISDSFGLSAERRLAIYYDAYRIRLTEALSEAFGKTHSYVGDESFSQLCSAYIDQHPSRFRSLRWFGDQFSEFVAASMPEYPVVAELAAFEWALGLAFDAADAPVLSAEDIQQLSADDWEQVGFVLQPSQQLLTFHYNAPAIWLALERNETPPEAVRGDLSRAWLIWRKNLQPYFRSLDRFEAIALRGLAANKAFSTVCAEAAELAESDITPKIAGWLQNWMAESVLAGISRTAQDQ
jgi:hypothetical protein